TRAPFPGRAAGGTGSVAAPPGAFRATGWPLHPSLENPEDRAGARAQRQPVDLAGAAERRVVDEIHLSWKRVRGAALQEEPLQLLGGGGPAVVEDHEGDRGFALDRVGDRDHEGLADRRVEEQHVLDLLRILVLPAHV